jgi:hypothetical protein
MGFPIVNVFGIPKAEQWLLSLTKRNQAAWRFAHPFALALDTSPTRAFVKPALHTLLAISALLEHPDP